MKTSIYDPAQWKLVPVEPTQEMIEAVDRIRHGRVLSHTLLYAAIEAAPEAAEQKPVAVAPQVEPGEIPKPGSVWRHTKGNLYTVEYIANEGGNPRYPVTVVYRGNANGYLWARPASDWHRSMTLAGDDQQLEPGGTPLSDDLEKVRISLGQERTPAYGDALALCRRLERQLAAPQPVPEAPEPDPADIAFLVEAYRYGQFADDMLDHPSPSCRSPAKMVREALRRVLAVWASPDSTTPAQAECRPLTDAKIKQIHDHDACLPDLVGNKRQWPEICRFARAVERACAEAWGKKLAGGPPQSPAPQATAGLKWDEYEDNLLADSIATSMSPGLALESGEFIPAVKLNDPATVDTQLELEKQITSMFKQPHDIKMSDGSPAYSCRPCGATENLHWYRDTSCPVCSNPECSAALDKEWAEAWGQ